MTAGPATVTHADEEPNGLASMLGSLLEQNLVRDPRRRRSLRPAVVSLVATDAGVRATLRIGSAGIEVANGGDPQPDLEIATDAHRLLELAAVPLRLGLPDPFTERGREVVRGLVSGRLRVRGLVRHPLLLTRVQRLLSAA